MGYEVYVHGMSVGCIAPIARLPPEWPLTAHHMAHDP